MIFQLLPVDGFIVRLTDALPDNYNKSLTHLYQPLIGPKPLMLYQTLHNELLLQDEESPQTHHTLMNYMMLALDEIYEARLKLEALGLLRTYKKVVENITVYTYELQPPYTPKAFFQDAMLSSLLYHYIGEQKYYRLKHHFLPETLEDKGENVTANFGDVFQTMPETELPQMNVESETQIEEGTVDFSWLEQMLKQRMIPVHRVLTKENRKLIEQMLILYDLESFEIDKAVIFSLNEENRLDHDEFKRTCRDIFQAKNKDQSIRLIPKIETRKQHVQKEQPLSKEEKLIRELETISPKQLLEDLSSGGNASVQDMKLIEEVMLSQGLPAPVMNVLIHYVLLQADMKLSRAYLEKIASHWSRAKLKTAREAMEFAKRQWANVEKAKAKRKANRTNYRRTSSAADILPDWYKQGKHKEKPQPVEPTVMTEEQKQVAELLKQYSNGN